PATSSIYTLSLHDALPISFITKDGRPVATFGLMGGAMQPQGHMQVFSRIVDFGQNPQAAIDGPRWRVHENDGSIWTEEHMPSARSEEHTSELQSQSNLVCR